MDDLRIGVFSTTCNGLSVIVVEFFVVGPLRVYSLGVLLGEPLQAVTSFAINFLRRFKRLGHLSDYLCL